MGTSARTGTLTRGKAVLLVIGALILGTLAGPPLASGATKAVTSIADGRSGTLAHVSAQGRLLTSVCGSKSCAAVDKGKLRVGDGGGPLTVDGKVGVRGPVTVNGAVTAYPYPPTKIFSTYFDILNSGTQGFVRKGHTVRLTSITLDNSSGDSAEISIYPLTGGSSTCTGGFFDTRYWSGRANSATNVTVSFPSPLVINDRCAQIVETLGNAYVHVTITGYEVS